MSDQPVQLAPTVQFGPYECNCYKTSYPHGGATALYLDHVASGEPIATATVNIPEANHLLEGKAGEEFIFVKDYSENSGMMAALEAAGIAADTGRRVPAGFTKATVARMLL